MVMSMISNSTLLESLWEKALKKTTYILNRVQPKATTKKPYEHWIGRKPSLKHFHIWGCMVEAQPYRSKEKKLVCKTISSYFIGHSEHSRGYKFWDPTLKTIFEDVGFRRNKVRNITFEEELVSIPEPIPIVASDNAQVIIPIVVQEVNAEPKQDNVEQIPIEQPQQQVPLQQSIRERKKAIPNDYIVFLQEHDGHNGMMKDNPINFHQAMKSTNSQDSIKVMNEEYKSMQDNKFWELVPLPEDIKPIRCKWIFEIKQDVNGNVERYKVCLVEKGYTQKEGIDFKETFSLVSMKDSFRTIMALVAYFDLELLQMDAKIKFLNGDIDNLYGAT